MRRFLVLAFALAAPLVLAAPAQALLGVSLPAGQPGVLLVGFASGASGDVSALVASLSGTVTGVAPEISVLRASVPDVGLATTLLKASPLVDLVEPDGASRLAGAQWNGAQWNGAEWNGAQWNGAEWNSASGAPASANDPGRVVQWGLLASRAAAAWSSEGIGSRAAPVCVLDSGIDLAHEDLAANLWTGKDGAHGVNLVGPGAPQDDAGHGSHVAGIAAAVVGNGLGVAGVANEPLMAVKVLDSTGQGRESDVAFGLVWCATHGAKVALMALSADGTTTFKRALAFASQKDVLLVASAGNGGPCASCVAFPASDPHVLAVAALDKTLAPASFSAKGAKVGISAPGVDIASTFAGNAYRSGSGTSQAAAFVAGAAALVRDANPSLSAAQAQAALVAGARDIGPAGPDPAYGAGLLDVRAALAAASG